MRASELKELSGTELELKLLELRKQQFSLRLKKSTGSLEKTHPIGQIRKTIARIKTILTEKQSEVSRGE
jgi:large subunit ribosomal protein L29